jgi:hypothetical protein
MEMDKVVHENREILIFTCALKPNKMPKHLFCLHMFCNGAQVMLHKIGVHGNG